MSFKGEIGEVVEIERGDGEISSFEWRIPGFLSLAGEGGDRYESPVFFACGGDWCFKVYPKGLRRDLPLGSVTLILRRLDDGPPKTLIVTIGIRGPHGVRNRRKRIQEFSRDDPVCYWSGFCSRSMLTEQNSRLNPRNVLILTLKIGERSVVTREGSTQTDEDSEKQGVEELGQSLHRLLESKKECDVTIKVQDKEFPAHRLFLQARSAVFEAMFSHDMVERQSGVVSMEDCDPESFPDFLEHVYTGSTRMISSANVFSLYVAADKYDLNTLKKECMEFVKNNLSASCFCEAMALAVKHDERELIECATQFFCNNELEILKTVEWQIFLKENMTIGNELLIKAFSK